MDRRLSEWEADAVRAAHAGVATPAPTPAALGQGTRLAVRVERPRGASPMEPTANTNTDLSSPPAGRRRRLLAVTAALTAAAAVAASASRAANGLLYPVFSSPGGSSDASSAFLCRFSPAWSDYGWSTAPPPQSALSAQHALWNSHQRWRRSHARHVRGRSAMGKDAERGGSGDGFMSMQEEDRPLYEGWHRLDSKTAWDFLLGASPFSYTEAVRNARREGYMKNLIWLDAVPDGESPSSSGGAQYPAAFTFYLSRMLLARDSRVAAWWVGANSESDEPPELIFARFQASVADVLERQWRGRSGELAKALIKRFGNRYPFDAKRQTRLLFSLLPEEMLQGSYFDQEFDTDRDELREVFDSFDVDKSGLLSGEEIREAFKRLGGWLSEAEVKQMLEDAFADGNGEVSFAGFKDAVISSLKAPQARQAQGIPDDEWWRDPAALMPADLLDTATAATLHEAHDLFIDQMRREMEKVQDGAMMLDDQSPVTDASAASAGEEKARSPLVPRVPALVRERPLGRLVYALFTAAGAVSCTLTHVALVPIDVVKTLQQTEPLRFAGRGLLSNVAVLWQEGGPSEFFLGLGATLVGYLWYGATVFPGYEFFKRRLLRLCGPRLGSRLRVPLVLLSGAIATFFACIGVCPAEAVRIRTVQEHGFRSSFLFPIPSLYAGFAPLLFRQVFFGMAKFLVFDTFAAAVYRRFPKLAESRAGSLAVSLCSGATAGLVATFVSQPSDAILTKLALSPKLGIVGAAAALWAEGGMSAFFAGVATRCVWAASIIAGQFVLYDIAKQLFRVTASDLTQTADPVATALQGGDPGGSVNSDFVPNSSPIRRNAGRNGGRDDGPESQAAALRSSVQVVSSRESRDASMRARWHRPWHCPQRRRASLSSRAFARLRSSLRGSL